MNLASTQLRIEDLPAAIQHFPGGYLLQAEEPRAFFLLESALLQDLIPGMVSYASQGKAIVHVVIFHAGSNVATVLYDEQALNEVMPIFGRRPEAHDPGTPMFDDCICMQDGAVVGIAADWDHRGGAQIVVIESLGDCGILADPFEVAYNFIEQRPGFSRQEDPFEDGRF